jgi:hypothetical protein
VSELKSLELDIKSEKSDGIITLPENIFDSIKSLINLEKLQCDEFYSVNWLPHHIELFRSLPSLTHLLVWRHIISSDELQLLAADPIPLNIKKITNFFLLYLDNSHLPYLTRLQLTTLGCDVNFSPTFITQMNCLTSLDIWMNEEVEVEETVNVISSCKKLTRLGLYGHPTMNSNHIHRILSSLPLIQHIILNGLPSLSSLSFLSSTPHLSKTVRLLWIEKSRLLPSTEILHIPHLSSLEVLTIKNSFTKRLDEAMVLQFTNGSIGFNMVQAVMPNFKQFVYQYENV